MGSLGEWLIATRERAGISQRSLSRSSGISQAQISKIEAGLVGSELKTVSALVSALAGPDATTDEVEALRREALAASVGLSREIERVPVDDPDKAEYVAFWDNAPSPEARRRLKIIAETLAQEWTGRDTDDGESA